MKNQIILTVIQTPAYVTFICPLCEYEHEINYKEMCENLGDVCDWPYSKLTCPECGKQVSIEFVEWD